jgi:hypothetical protein
MSVDYEAHFGLGAKVQLKENSKYEKIWEFFEETDEDFDKKYSWFRTGSAYRGEEDYFLVLDNEKIDEDTPSRLNELAEYINSSEDLERVGELGLVGGLHVS